MIEEGQIYRHVSSEDNGKIYARIIHRYDYPLSSEFPLYNMKILAPTIWTGKNTWWVLDNYVTVNTDSLRHWEIVYWTECLKCKRENPCRSMEVLCSGCRVEFGMDFKKHNWGRK